MKALVVKTKGKAATLLLDDGQFIRMRNQHYQIGEMIMMKKRSNQNRILALATTAAMLVVLLTAGVFAYATPAYYVSLDVNPSLVLKVNLFDRLIGLEAMNEDAEAVLAELDWKNKDVEDVLAMAVQKIKQEGYFDEGGDILIAAAGKGEARTEELLAGLKNKVEELDLEDVSIQAEAVSLEMVEKAKALGLTPGKYNLITRLLDEDVNDENAEESVKNLMARFTATKGKGVLGKEVAESAMQNNGADILPLEDEAGNITVEQRTLEASQNASEAVANASENASEAVANASQTASEAVANASEVLDKVTETLPVSTNQPPVEPNKGTEVEIPLPTDKIPTDTPVEIPVVPTTPTVPSLPTASSGRP